MLKKFPPIPLNILFLVCAFLLSVAIGPVYISPSTLLRILVANFPGLEIAANWPETSQTILLAVRLPHTALILLTGAALGGSGAAYQGVFRNPLADPYLIGVASGAGLGAIVAMAFRWPSGLTGMFSIPIAAFLGALLTVVVVYQIARVGKSLPTTSMILAGVAVSSFTTSLTSFLMLRSNQELRRALSWLLGGGAINGWDPVIAASPYIFLGLGFLLTSGHALNVLQFGEEQAQQLGLPVEKVKAGLILAASINDCRSGFIFGCDWLYRIDRTACGPDYLGTRLPAVNPIIHSGRRQRIIVGRPGGTHRSLASGAAGRDCHGFGRCTFLSLGAATP